MLDIPQNRLYILPTPKSSKFTSENKTFLVKNQGKTLYFAINHTACYFHGRVAVYKLT